MRILLFVLSLLPSALVAQGVPIPLHGYAVNKPLADTAAWSADIIDAGHGETCLIARESGRVWAVRERFVWQLAAPRRMTRIEVYGDSVLIADRDPERREEYRGVVVLSDSIYRRLSEFTRPGITVRSPGRNPVRTTISLVGFNVLKPLFDDPNALADS